MVKVYYTYNQASQHGMSISKTSNFLLNPIGNPFPNHRQQPNMWS